MAFRISRAAVVTGLARRGATWQRRRRRPPATSPSAPTTRTRCPRRARPRCRLLRRCRRGDTDKVNTVDHGTFQDQINSYLQGTPDDVFTWFAGYRMQFFADQGLARRRSTTSGRRSAATTPTPSRRPPPATTASSTSSRSTTTPGWSSTARASSRRRATPSPTTFEEFVALAAKMQADGLVPLAFADKDGWPAMGTFDILNMRLNGYQFHVDLMAGKEKWTDPRVTAVFETWKDAAARTTQDGALGRTWQEAAQPMANKARPACTSWARSPASRCRRPAAPTSTSSPSRPLGTEFDAEMGIDAPIDGFMLSQGPGNPEGAKALLECLAPARRRSSSWRSTRNNVGAANDVDTSGYTDVQKKSAEIIAGSGRDRPVPRPRHASRTSPARTACRPSCRTSSTSPTRTSMASPGASRTSGTASRCAVGQRPLTETAPVTERRRPTTAAPPVAGGAVARPGEPRQATSSYSPLTRRDRLILGAHGRHPDVPRGASSSCCPRSSRSSCRSRPGTASAVSTRSSSSGSRTT